MSKGWAVGAALILVSWLVCPAIAADKLVEVEGRSPLSREDAIRQAHRLAVEQTVGVFVRSETEVENFAVVKDKVLSRAEGYITEYSELKSWNAGGQFHVLIRAAVSLNRIKDDLLAMHILLESMQRPRIMVLIEERYLGMPDAGMQVAATELTARLQAKGFDLVDQAQVERARAMDQGRQALAGNTAAATQLGLDLGAQYVVVGKAAVQDSGEAYEGTGLKTVQASLQLQAVQTQTGLILGSVIKNARTAHVSPLTGATQTLQNAVGKAVEDYLVDAITRSFQDFLNNGAPIKLHVTGVKTFQGYKSVTPEIQSLDRIVSARQEGWNKAGGLLALDLRFRGTSEELAYLLDGLRVGESSSLEVIDFGPQRVECQLR